MKIIASDYDGTLNEGGVGEEKRIAIRKWREEGNLFGIVSGRGIANLISLAEEDGVECDFLIGDNGASVAKGNGDIISETLCDGEVAREIIEYFFTKGCTWSWVRPYPECIVLPEGSEPKPWEKTPSTMPKIEKFTQISAAFESPEKAELSAVELRKRYGDKLNILQNGHCIDIVRLDVNKAVGIYKLLEAVGAKYEDIITVGDNFNDADMIKEFNSYAMDNAVPLIKELAGRTTLGVTDLIYSEL
ncbi:MAG: HAD-IIB family hydrolase [Ruminococcaceae bacterium]|nr:HAD-IIB family hydrolase [Oscillospiraceae bacterium]